MQCTHTLAVVHASSDKPQATALYLQLIYVNCGFDYTTPSKLHEFSPSVQTDSTVLDIRSLDTLLDTPILNIHALLILPHRSTL